MKNRTPECDEAMKGLRDAGARLLSTTNAIRWWWLAGWWGATNPRDANEAARCMVGLSNSVYRSATGDHHEKDDAARVRQLLHLRLSGRAEDSDSQALRSPAREDMGLRVSFWSLVAVVVPEYAVDQILEGDVQRELASNTQLAAAGEARVQEYRASLRTATVERALILRWALVRSVAWLASAVAVAALIASLTRLSPSLALSRVLSTVSLASFVLGTLGRMGWKGQTVAGDTVMERADDLLFRVFYWVGTLTGTLALWR